MDLQAFAKKYGTEKQCLEYLYKLRWPGGYRCPRCNHNHAWTIDKDKLKYKCKACSYQTSVLAGTIFHDTQKPITDWFRAIWYVSSQNCGTSALGLKNELGLGSYRTAWTWLQKIRQAMIYSEQDKLQGVVAVDEFPFASAFVLIAIELNDKKIGRIRMIPLAPSKDTSAAIASFVEHNIELGSVIVCEKNKKYGELPDKGYTIRSSKAVREGNYIQLPYVHTVLSYIKEKKLLGTLERTQDSKHSTYYLDECCFKFNRRNNKKAWFNELLRSAVQSEPIPNKSFVKEDREK